VNHPERLGKYQITGVLGEGAMGVVYRGFDPDIRRVVALKTIRRQGGDAAPGRPWRRARRAFATRRRPPGGCSTRASWGVRLRPTTAGVAYIAMEYVEGHTLAHYLASRERFSDADVASMAAQLLDALGHAHAHGVWHRDIKPSNLIMTQRSHQGRRLRHRAHRERRPDHGQQRDGHADVHGARAVHGPPHGPPRRPVCHRRGAVPADRRPPALCGHTRSTDVPGGQRHAAAAFCRRRGHARRPLSTVLCSPHWPRTRARYASAAAFRNAVAAALGQPVPPAVSQDAVYALPMPTEYAPTERIAPLHATGSAPTHWDPAVLAQVESSLARHVGPLAAVLVRRASRTCADLPALQAALAEQITNAAAREAFLGARSGSAGASGGATGGTAGSRGTGSSGSSTPFQGSGARAPAPAPATFGSMTMGAPVSDALLEQAQRLLAQHLGPIARVVVKRAAERTRQRAALFTLLADAVPEAARSKLLADLARLS
jgi:hypothetical protein